MWKCPKYNRSFNVEKQQHDCGKIETIYQFIDECDEKVRPILIKAREVIRVATLDAIEKVSYNTYLLAKRKHYSFCTKQK